MPATRPATKFFYTEPTVAPCVRVYRRANGSCRYYVKVGAPRRVDSAGNVFEIGPEFSAAFDTFEEAVAARDDFVRSEHGRNRRIALHIWAGECPGT